MMIKRGADMHGRKAGDGGADQGMNHEQTFGQGAVLRPDRRQFKQSEYHDWCAIGGGGHPADQWLHYQQRIESPMRGARGRLLERRDVLLQRQRRGGGEQDTAPGGKGGCTPVLWRGAKSVRVLALSHPPPT